MNQESEKIIQRISSREATKKAYSGSGAGYDSVRGDHAGRILGEYDIAIVKSMVPFKKAGDAMNVEVGSGTGRITIPLLEGGYSITATDINESLLQELHAKIVASHQFENRCGVKIEDGFALTFSNNEIDGLLCIHVIPRFTTRADKVALLKEMSRTLKPGGKMLFNFSNKRSPIYGKLSRKNLISYEDIVNELASLGLDVMDVRGKWIVSASLLRRVPQSFRKGILSIDKLLQKFWVSRAWDVFVLARRRE